MVKRTKSPILHTLDKVIEFAERTKCSPCRRRADALIDFVNRKRVYGSDISVFFDTACIHRMRRDVQAAIRKLKKVLK